MLILFAPCISLLAAALVARRPTGQAADMTRQKDDCKDRYYPGMASGRTTFAHDAATTTNGDHRILMMAGWNTAEAEPLEELHLADHSTLPAIPPCSPSPNKG